MLLLVGCDRDAGADTSKSCQGITTSQDGSGRGFATEDTALQAWIDTSQPGLPRTGWVHVEPVAGDSSRHLLRRGEWRVTLLAPTKGGWLVEQTMNCPVIASPAPSTPA